MPLSYADETRPNAATLLDRRIALWKGADGWAAVEDACPHRLAPLSTGAVGEDGTLICRFHGWRFDETGACVRVPNAPSAQAAARLCGAAQTCARSYPVTVSAGLIWLWLDSGPEGAARAAATPVPVAAEEGEDLSWELTVQPISYESMVENSLDPSHAPFLHAGLGTFGAAPTAVPMERPGVSTKPTPSGFVISHGGYDVRTSGMNATRRFVAPNLVDVRYAYPPAAPAARAKPRRLSAKGQLPAASAGRTAHFPIFFIPATPFETRVLTGIRLPSPPAWVPRRVKQPLSNLLHVAFFALDATWRFNDQVRGMRAMFRLERVHFCGILVGGSVA